MTKYLTFPIHRWPEDKPKCGERYAFPTNGQISVPKYTYQDTPAENEAFIDGTMWISLDEYEELEDLLDYATRAETEG